MAEEIEPSGLRLIARKGSPMFVEKMVLDPKVEAPRRFPRVSPVLSEFYKRELGTKLGREFSWNGFEHKVLLINQRGTGFENLAYLLGVAQEFDGRAVVSGDLDADGRMDQTCRHR